MKWSGFPRWLYGVLALVWAGSVLMDAAALALDPQFAEVQVSWVEFFVKRSVLAAYWMAVSVAALAWFHERPVHGGNVWSTLGKTAALGGLVVVGHAFVLSALLLVMSKGAIDWSRVVALAWSQSLLYEYLTAWKVAIFVHAYLYYQRSVTRQREGDALRSKLAQTELALFRAQFEPHFLFNALNSIASLVRLGRNGDATDALSKLGALLRGVLHARPSRWVTWEWERRFTQAYLELQQLRFGERLHVEIDADDVPTGTAVPALLLQPLIENAVRHGPLQDARPCSIHVEVRCERQDVVIVVRNPLAAKRAAPGHGLGLANVRARLHALYAGAATMTAEPVDDDFVVRIVVPQRPEADADAPAPAESTAWT